MAADPWITVQLGHEANCVSSQFWNSRYLSQNSLVDFSLFRETCDASVVPRLVSFDWGPIGSDRKGIDPHEYSSTESGGFAWFGPLQKIRRNSSQSKKDVSQNSVCNFDPKSLIKPPSVVQSLQYFSQGVEVYKDKLGEEFLEQIRKELESCDHLGGFQFIIDSFSGISGFANELFYGLEDEFHCKVPSILFGCGVENSHNDYIPLKVLNEAKVLPSLLDNNIHYIPLHYGKVYHIDSTKDFWLNGASDLAECSEHGNSCTLSAIALDCFYALFIAPDAASKNAALAEILKSNSHSTMSRISLLPLVSNKNSSEKWQLRRLITEGFRHRKSPPLYTVDLPFQKYTSEEEKTKNRNVDLAMWIVRGTQWSQTMLSDIQRNQNYSLSDIKKLLLDATGLHEESIVRTEPFGFRRIVVSSSTANEAESTQPPFHEGCPLELIGEVSSNRVWNIRYYDMAIDHLKKFRNRKYFEEAELDDEMERIINAKENLDNLS
ncbi:hypothetical protein GpartN1_g6752.t1 [Galdieria partita]|uniref:DML1/Misato tubulin domain-containing protein n=1 Tax=Galdieria partita TaxID=83374 RepID=A0A9C7Q2E1_9RHOD|nr:hypothetical protein GpartN1_g6752.t1 [Galdieria partita]